MQQSERTEIHSEGDSVVLESDHESSEALHTRISVVTPVDFDENSPVEYRKTFILGGRTMKSSKWGSDSNEPCSLDETEDVRALSIATPASESVEGSVESISRSIVWFQMILNCELSTQNN